MLIDIQLSSVLHCTFTNLQENMTMSTPNRKITFSVQLDKETLDFIDTLATHEKRSRSNMIEVLIEIALAGMGFSN